jgi:hypothetical protein
VRFQIILLLAGLFEERYTAYINIYKPNSLL